MQRYLASRSVFGRWMSLFALLVAGCADGAGVATARDPSEAADFDPAPVASPAIHYPIRGLTDTETLGPVGPPVDFWSNGPQRIPTNILRGEEVPADDLSAIWEAGWSRLGLRVRVTVRDDVIVSDSPWPWEDDSVEIYLDPDASAGETYDGRNDYQLVFRPGDGKAYLGVRSARNTEGIRVATVSGGAARYSVEVFVPWKLLGVTPALPQSIGIDVHVNDDDDGGMRDTKLGSFAGRDDAWTNPSVFGRLPLVTPVDDPGSHALSIRVLDSAKNAWLEGARVAVSLGPDADLGRRTTDARGETMFGSCDGEAPPLATTREVGGFYVAVEAAGFTPYRGFHYASPTVGYCSFLDQVVRLQPKP
ncbi:MAG: sugar-binding protein [Polyangiales bacterium]